MSTTIQSKVHMINSIIKQIKILIEIFQIILIHILIHKVIDLKIMKFNSSITYDIYYNTGPQINRANPPTQMVFNIYFEYK
jgi:hypothetical protein